MRLLWARVGVPYSPATGLPIESQTVSQMVDRVLALPEGTRIYVLAPVVRGRKGEYKKELAEFLRKGYQRVKIDGAYYEIGEVKPLDKKFTHGSATLRGQGGRRKQRRHNNAHNKTHDVPPFFDRYANAQGSGLDAAPGANSSSTHKGRKCRDYVFAEATNGPTASQTLPPAPAPAALP